MSNEDLVLTIQHEEGCRETEEQLYKNNVGLIQKICRKYARYAEMEDLMQEAYLSLIEAAKHYKPDHGVKFSSYAAKAIKYGCIRYLHQSGSVVRIPENVARNLSKLKQLEDYFQSAVNRKPYPEEILRFLNINNRQFLDLMSAKSSYHMLSIDSPIKNDHGEDLSLSDMLCDDVDIESEYLDKECIIEIMKYIEGLPEMQRDVIHSHYWKRKSVQSIAAEKGCNVGEIRKIEEKTLRNMRRDKVMREIAERYGYDTKQSYKWPVSKFKDTWTSSTEWLALKKLEVCE